MTKENLQELFEGVKLLPHYEIDTAGFEIISRCQVYDLNEAVRASKHPMAVDLEELNEDITSTTVKLAQCKNGTAHDCFLKGILVNCNLDFTNKVWVEFERYHFADIVSSTSTMHRITEMLNKRSISDMFSPYVDEAIIERLMELAEEFEELSQIAQPSKQQKEDRLDLFLKIVYSMPSGIKVPARVTLNYLQLKSMYIQRKRHKLPEWKAFCKEIEQLPFSFLFTGKEATSELVEAEIKKWGAVVNENKG